MYVVKLRTSAFRSLKKLPVDQQLLVVDALRELAESPFTSKKVKRLKGASAPLYRFRVGRARVVYIVVTSEELLDVIDIFIRKGDSDYRRVAG